MKRFDHEAGTPSNGVSFRTHTAIRVYSSEICFVVGASAVAIASGKKQGAVGSVPGRLRTHCVRDEERVSHTPHQMAYRFAHILPLKHIYQNNIYFVRVLLNASANGKMDVAGRCFSRRCFSRSLRRTSMNYSQHEYVERKKRYETRYSAFTITNLNPYESKVFYEVFPNNRFVKRNLERIRG